MWGFGTKRNSLRERMLVVAPEADPHQFVRRFLQSKPPRLQTRPRFQQLPRQIQSP